MTQADYALFHSPFTKLVNKSYARLSYLDFLRNDTDPRFATVPKEFKSVSTEASYEHKEIGQTFGNLIKSEYKQKVEPTLLLSKQLGNTYTGSLYMSILSLVSQKTDNELVLSTLTPYIFIYFELLVEQTYAYVQLRQWIGSNHVVFPS